MMETMIHILVIKIIDKPVKKENTDYQNMKQQNALYRKTTK